VMISAPARPPSVPLWVLARTRNGCVLEETESKAEKEQERTCQ
jgi:hypothetical protein